MAKKTQSKVMAKRKPKRRKGKKQSRWLHTMLVGLILLSIVFLSSAVVLFIGLLPMFVAFFVDRSKKKTKAITVGAMNIAGCVPFLMELWTSGGTMETALSIIFDPMAIIVIYAAAGIGYLIDWTATIMIANLLYQRGVARKDTIEKRQKELIERWGEEVNGKVALDHDGFPIEEQKPAKS